MLTREDIVEVERIENELHARIHQTCAARNESKQAWEAWNEATADWHTREHPTDRLWEEEFRAHLRGSRREAMEDAILYLEADPWYFRSGYLKELLIRDLKAAELSEQDRKRLRDVIWKVAAGKNRREFRRYCSLAMVVADPEFLQMLAEVSPAQDNAVKGKFRYLLNYLRRNARDGETSWKSD